MNFEKLFVRLRSFQKVPFQSVSIFFKFPFVFAVFRDTAPLSSKLISPERNVILSNFESFYFFFLLFRAIRFSTAEQFFLVATRCSQGNRPLVFLITLLFTVLVVSRWNIEVGLASVRQQFNKILE